MIFVLLAYSAVSYGAATEWRNATIYFVFIDRFYDGDKENNSSYGREYDKEQNIGTFHGGDLKGLTKRLRQGYFTDLGITAIWITSPLEQIHGWVPGANNEFKHYAYHGYFPLDYTRIDKNFGTEADFAEFVKTAHGQGIKVILDVVINHAGYADVKTIKDYSVNVLATDQYPPKHKYYEAFDYDTFSWMDWWGPEWVRARLPGYELSNEDETLSSLYFLPDFKTESESVVQIPEFFNYKKDTGVVLKKNWRVRDYLTDWMVYWVRQHGVDGFRVDAAKHIDRKTLTLLKEKASQAYRQWSDSQSSPPFPDDEFWMVGESFGHGVEDSDYFDLGFNSMINFSFYDDIRGNRSIDSIYQEYSNFMRDHEGRNILSFLSNHDIGLFERDRLKFVAKYFFFLPGAIQIFYGDETARPEDDFAISDRLQNLRSDMNWRGLDLDTLRVWQKLGRFRFNNNVVGAGLHKTISHSPYIFSRKSERDEQIYGFDLRSSDDLFVASTYGDCVFDIVNDRRYKLVEGKYKGEDIEVAVFGFCDED